MGVPDAALHLGITNRAVYRLIDEGSLPAYKLGRVIRLRRQNVEAQGGRSGADPDTPAGDSA